MEIDDLVVQNMLLDTNTGEVVGYTLMNSNGQVVALTKSKIIELDADLANYIDYVDATPLEVSSARNKYALNSNILYHTEEYEDEAYKRMKDNKISIWGDVFNYYHVVDLDSDKALQNVLTSSEDYND